MLITADKVFNGIELLTQVTVEVVDGVIAKVHSGVLPEAAYFPGILTAGFIDYHVNGGGGKLFNFAPHTATLRTMVRAHAKYGTTAMLPTLITDDIEVMERASDAVAQAIADEEPGILGIHFEGPHLSVPKKGVHKSEFIRAISPAEQALFSRSDLAIKLLTLAPENVAIEEIQSLVKQGVKVSIGHTNADFDTANAALRAGADGFTHLFNAMSPFTSREPGVLGAALAADEAWCGIILDGHHMHFSSAKIAHAAKPKGKLLIVTDAMSTIGSAQSEFDFFGLHVAKDGDKLATSDGTLAGSALDMITAVKNAVQQMSIELEEALNMASLYPAQYLGVADKMGSITLGKQADLVVFNQAFQVTNTWIAGTPIYQQE